ncbi:MAG TPA: sodium:proton antiporter [Candidatus Limnocylindrales bacterium]
MAPTSTAGLVGLFVILVALATAAALLVRRIRIPYTVVLVLLGLGAAVLRPQLQVQVPPDLILAVFLPGLVFESGYRLDLTELRRTFGAVAVLAVPGVILTAAAMAGVLALATGLPPQLGFLVGAMLAATDPAAVIAAIRRMRAPTRLATLIEAESVFNDGSAIVIFAVALTGLGGGLSLFDAAIQLAFTVTVSAIVGILAGFIAARVITRIDDHLIELSITLVLAYGTYMLADAFHQSGIIATVTAAMVLGLYTRRGAMSERSLEAVDTVWEFAAFLLTALVFLLIGLVISVPDLVDALVPIGWGIVAILGARAIVVYGLVGGASRLLRPPDRRIPAGWLNVMVAAGMRGAVSVALALSLPPTVPQRTLLVEITFGITLFTLIAQGLALGPIVRRSLPPDTMRYDDAIPTQ